MRKSFFDALFRAMENDPQAVLITADMGFELLERFRDKMPQQFINAGISEANAVAIAAGMALRGKRPYVYSITPFVTYRCLEQIRIDVCYHNLDVKIVGVGNGLDYAQSGTTHQPTEDIAIMRPMPNLRIACPADPIEAGAIVPLIHKTRGPWYVRLGRGKEQKIHDQPPNMPIGKAIRLFGNGEGQADAAIFSNGSIGHNAYLAAKSLANKGFVIRHYSMNWMKPLDEDTVIWEMKNSMLIVSVEENTEIGGMAGALSQVMARQSGKKMFFLPIALPDSFQKTVGSLDHLRKINGLDAPGIESRIAAEIARLKAG